MEIKNIKIKELGKKTFTVLTSNRNVRRMNEFQLEIAKISDIEEDAPITEQFKANIGVITATLSFLRAVLNLSDEQMEILEDLDTERTQEIANYVSGRLMGLSDEQLEEIKKENVENPKE
jgi:hypothetical protein